MQAYLQVDSSDDPYAILGLSQDDAPTASQVKTAYRLLALSLHPDKASSGNLAAAHHRLFLKLQKAHDTLLTGNDRAPNSRVIFEHLAIHEGPISLHQRNLDFKASLQKRRDIAIKERHELNAKKVAAKAAWEPKPTVAREQPDRAAERLIAHQGGKLTNKQARQAVYAFAQKQVELQKPWQSKQSSNNASVKVVKREKKEAKQKRRAATQASVGEGIHENEHDTILAAPADIAARRFRKLLSGRPSSVSLADEKRRENSLTPKELSVEK